VWLSENSHAPAQPCRRFAPIDWRRTFGSRRRPKSSAMLCWAAREHLVFCDCAGRQGADRAWRIAATCRTAASCTLIGPPTAQAIASVALREGLFPGLGCRCRAGRPSPAVVPQSACGWMAGLPRKHRTPVGGAGQFFPKWRAVFQLLSAEGQPGAALASWACCHCRKADAAATWLGRRLQDSRRTSSDREPLALAFSETTAGLANHTLGIL
jgi:hypothetical protein